MLNNNMMVHNNDNMLHDIAATEKTDDGCAPRDSSRITGINPQDSVTSKITTVKT